MPDNDIVLTKLHPSRMSLAESKRVIHYICPPPGTTIEDIVKPAYWTHTGFKLQPTDRIEVHSEDGGWFAELHVRSCGRTYANVEVLRFVEFKDAVQVNADNGHEVQWKGPHHRFAVVRKADNTILQAGFADKDIAAGWLISNAKSLAA
jgi:hypothetical protein